MKRSSDISPFKSLTSKQAFATLLAGLFLSILVGAVELLLESRKMRTEVQSQTLQLLTLVEATAAEAAFQLNPELAEQVVTGLFSGSHVASVVLRDDFGRVMYSLGEVEHSNNRIYQYLFDNILYYKKNLYYRINGNNSGRVVGELEVTLDQNTLGQAFINRSLYIFSLSLLKTLGIVILMVWVFAFLITGPLLRVCAALQTVNPEEPGRWQRPYLKYNKGDELDSLVKGLDKLLKAFQLGLDQRDHLHTISSIDGLTGLHNRRNFDMRLDELWQDARVNQKSIALIFMDIDNFKPFNDNYGHAAGDDCLKRVAEILKSTVTRPGDAVARYGGEEFVCILPETDLQGAYQLAGRLQKNVAKENILHAYSPNSERITFSIGIAAEVPMPNEMSPERLLHLADQRLYRAKDAGRNCIITN